MTHEHIDAIKAAFYNINNCLDIKKEFTTKSIQNFLKNHSQFSKPLTDLLGDLTNMDKDTWLNGLHKIVRSINQDELNRLDEHTFKRLIKFNILPTSLNNDQSNVNPTNAINTQDTNTAAISSNTANPNTASKNISNPINRTIIINN